MTAYDKKEKYPLIVSIYYCLTGLICFISSFFVFAYASEIPGGVLSGIVVLLYSIATVAAGVVIIKKGISSATATVMIIKTVLMVIAMIISSGILGILGSVADIVLCVLVWKVYNNKPIKVWFLPALLKVIPIILVVALIGGLMASDYGKIESAAMFLYLILYMIFFLIDPAITYIMGLWLKDNAKQVSVIGGAEDIVMYKELLDSGIITQEEFEEKKRQILNKDENI